MFERLADEWLGEGNTEALPGFRDYLMKEVRSPFPGRDSLLPAFCFAGLRVRRTCTLLATPREVTRAYSRLPALLPWPQFGGEVLLRGLAGAPLELRDAGALGLLGELAAALQLVHAKCGQAYLDYLCGWVHGRRGQLLLAWTVQEAAIGS